LLIKTILETLVDIYTDFLLCSNGLATSTGLSTLLGGQISHDKFTRMLSSNTFDSSYLWERVKPFIKSQSKKEGLVILSVDDSIEEKYYTDESDLICWHFDHVFKRNVKGVNFMTAMASVGEANLPCAVEFIKKDLFVNDEKTGKEKRKSSKTKNELFVQMVGQCHKNFHFDYIVADCWYSATSNMENIKNDLKSNFVIALKSNRKVALSKEDKDAKKYVGIESLQLGQQTVEIWLEGLDFPLLLVKQVFKNEDDTVGELYLACSDLNLSYEQINTIYQKRWGVEVYHKSTKSNASFAKSPTKTIKTQMNHFMLSIIAYVKLEGLKLMTNINHFAIKARIYQAALKAAYQELKTIKGMGSPNCEYSIA
jgi:hypothetical protein